MYYIRCMKSRTYFYHDELNDEFAGSDITPVVIDEHWDYTHDSVRRKAAHVFWYYIVAKPLSKIFLKIHYGHRIVGREKLKPFKKQALFLYGNHTNNMADPFIPSMLFGLKPVYVVAHPDNVSIPKVGWIMKHLGALPIPGDKASMKNFLREIDVCTSEKACVMIYPEAHIWPFYTKIRHFKDTSFAYPVKEKCPVFCFTNTYQKRRFTSVPRIVTYVEGPFYADETLPQKEAKTKLRDEVYSAMVRDSLHSNVEVNKFIYDGGSDDKSSVCG